MLRGTTVFLLLALTGIAYGQIACRSPYTNIGNNLCVYVAAFVQADWDEAIFFCSEMQGELLMINEIQIYMDVLDYLHFHGVQTRNYWIGGTDRIVDGTFTWINGENITLGAPYWADKGYMDEIYVQEPSDHGQDNHDCLALDGSRFLYFDDADCYSLKATICKPMMLSKTN